MNPINPGGHSHLHRRMTWGIAPWTMAAKRSASPTRVWWSGKMGHGPRHERTLTDVVTVKDRGIAVACHDAPCSMP